MAKNKANVKGTNGPPAPQAEGESVSAYFRKIFEENPKLLKGRSNEELLKRWLADHPGHKEVPQKIKNNLANIKSVLRKQRRKGGGRPNAEQPVVAVSAVASPKVAARVLEALEAQIDDCLDHARRLDREGLAEVIGLLRRARNAVVWKAGQ
jgi:hypothetical protein